VKAPTLEERVLQYLHSHEEQLIQFARDLVATPSATPPGDERAVAKRICEELDDLELGKAEIIAAKAERPNISLHLHFPLEGPKLIFSGHMDTKPPGNSAAWKHPPLDPVLKDGFLYGLGAADMKSGIAAMVYAAAAVSKVSDHLGGHLQLLFTADEEGGSFYGAKYLSENNHVHGDAMLISESAGVRRELEFVAWDGRGAILFDILVHGDQMHSSLSDELQAVNASVKAASLITRLAYDFQRPGFTMNAAATLKSGVHYGIVPGLAEFGCDLRVPPGVTERQIRTELDAWLEEQKRCDPNLRAEISCDALPCSWIAPVSFPREHSFRPALEAALQQVLGEIPPAVCYPGATDAPWFAAAGVPTIPALGPGLLPLAHSPNERTLVDSIHKCARIYTLATLHYLDSSRLAL